MCDWRPFCAFSLIKHSIGRNTACHLLKKTENRIFLRIINALAVPMPDCEYAAGCSRKIKRALRCEARLLYGWNMIVLLFNYPAGPHVASAVVIF